MFREAYVHADRAWHFHSTAESNIEVEKEAIRAPEPKLLDSLRANSASRRLAPTDALGLRQGLRLAIDFLLPRRNQRRQLSGNLGPLTNYIVTCTEICADIEQHRPSAVEEQLPVARADRLLRPRAYDTPEQRPLDFRHSSFEHREQIDPFQARLTWNRRARRRENRGGQVHRDSHLSRNATRRNASRPTEDRRHADAAFPHRPFVVEERRVARQPFAAVVVGEDHNCVLSQAQAVEDPEDSTDTLIGALEHRDVVRPRARRIVEWSEVSGVIACRGRLVGPLVGPVSGVVRDIDEERVAGILLDGFNGPVGDKVGHVARDLDRTVVLEKIGLQRRIATGGVLVVVDETALEPETIIEPSFRAGYLVYFPT